MLSPRFLRMQADKCLRSVGAATDLDSAAKLVNDQHADSALKRLAVETTLNCSGQSPEDMTTVESHCW